MVFKAAKCPNCSGDLQVPDNRDIVKCMYCGNDVVVREAIKLVIGVDVSNILHLADTAFESGNSEEAYGYYTKVLESDGKNIDAWFGKGMASGSMSTLANPRINEMITNFDKAIEYAEEDRKEEYKIKAAKTLTSIASAYYNLATEHYNEFKELDNSWSEYVDRALIIIQALALSYEYYKLKMPPQASTHLREYLYYPMMIN